MGLIEFRIYEYNAVLRVLFALRGFPCNGVLTVSAFPSRLALTLS